MVDCKALRVALRKATPSAAWRVGERTFEAGRVALRSREDDGSEYVFAVQIGPTPSEVTLWPDDPDWEVEPEVPSRGSAHAVAAMLALEQGVDQLTEAARPDEVLLALNRRGDRLSVQGFVVSGESRTPAPVPLPGSAARRPANRPSPAHGEDLDRGASPAALLQASAQRTHGG